MLVASTRALWDAFLAACQHDEQLMQSDHLLDTFVEQRVRAAAAALGCALPVAQKNGYRYLALKQNSLLPLQCRLICHSVLTRALTVVN